MTEGLSSFADPAQLPEVALPPVSRPAASPSVEEKKKSPGLGFRNRELPTYTKSLLRIKVPVVVTLARNYQPLGRIVELGTGSIIHFDKSCEEMLELEVGDYRVAVGEAVKVGDKFGLRITSIVLPEERFGKVKKDE